MDKDKNVCNPKVFREVFNKNAETLRNFMYYKCGDIDLAEDFVQESFVKLWDNCSKVIEEKAKSFLFTVANNLFLNNVAHQKVVLKHQQVARPHTTNESPEFLLEEKEFMLKLEKAIQELPEKQREVFLLNRIDKKKYKEIADLLDISVKAVEKRMSQALKTLREKIGKI